MKGVESIIHLGKTLAIVFRKKIKVKDLLFLTDDDNQFQVGFHNRKKGLKLTPHVHRIKKPLKVNTIQEVLYMEAGKIKVTIYTEKGLIVTKKILTRGDSILLISGGHGVEFLESSRIFQVKQGPYSNTVHSKIYIR